MSDEQAVAPINTSSGPMVAPLVNTAPRKVRFPRLRSWLQLWTPATFSDRMQLAGLVVTFLALLAAVVTVVGLTNQLQLNDHTNRVAIRGQLYQTENALLAEEGADDREIYTTTWSVLPLRVQGGEYARSMLKLVTSDSVLLAVGTAEALYRVAYDPETLSDSTNRSETADVRRLFLFIQSNLYHIHNAYDYQRDGILKPGEWATWKGIIGEMNAHPVLLAVVWHGYQNRYISKDFGDFLKNEICATAPLGDAFAKRNCDFARAFYPELFSPGWSDPLATY